MKGPGPDRYSSENAPPSRSAFPRGRTSCSRRAISPRSLASVNVSPLSASKSAAVTEARDVGIQVFLRFGEEGNGSSVATTGAANPLPWRVRLDLHAHDKEASNG